MKARTVSGLENLLEHFRAIEATLLSVVPVGGCAPDALLTLWSAQERVLAGYMLASEQMKEVPE